MSNKTTDEIFLEAVELVKTLKYCSTDDKLQLYGLYKQSLFGNNTTAIPSIFSPVDRSKWYAWDSFKNAENPKQQYIDYVRTLKKNENI